MRCGIACAGSGGLALVAPRVGIECVRRPVPHFPGFALQFRDVPANGCAVRLRGTARRDRAPFRRVPLRGDHSDGDAAAGQLTAKINTGQMGQPALPSCCMCSLRLGGVVQLYKVSSVLPKGSAPVFPRSENAVWALAPALGLVRSGTECREVSWRA